MNKMNLPEKDQLIYSLMNDTAVDYQLNQLLHDAFIEQAELYPERIALSYEGEDMTYGELHERSNRLAHFLRSQGVKRNQLVAVLMERGLEMMVSLYGIVKSGAAYVPIDPEYPAQRVQYMITDSQATVLISKRTYAGQIAEIADELERLKTLLFMDDEQNEGEEVPGVTTRHWAELQDQPVTTPVAINDPSDIAYMIYTSGSTGQPKGVTVPHLAIVNRLLWHQDQFQATPDDVIAQRTSVCFDVSVWELFWALRHGAKISIIPTDVVKDAQRMHAHLVKEKVTVMHFVPSLFTVFVTSIHSLDSRVRAIPSMRWIVTSGEALPAKTVNLWFDLFENAPPIANLYGPTEAAVDVSCWVMEGPVDQVFIGKPIANTQLYVLNPEGHIVPVNEKGELHIGGVQLATGYHNKPEKTAEAFIPNHLPGTPGDRLYRTGDLARVLPDGTIEYLGRIDNQVKVRGYRIEMGEIEEALTQHPDVDMAGLIVRQGPDGNNELFAFYKSPREDLTATELKEYLGQRMPAYMVPARLRQVAEMPFSPNGKLDRKVLAAWAEESFVSTGEYVAPTTPTQMKLAEIWADILKQERVGCTDNFFDLGGHSLLAMQLFNRTYNEWKVNVSLPDLFMHPVLEQLASHIDWMLDSGKQGEVIRIPRLGQRGNYGEHYGLSNAQKRLWFLQQFDPTSTAYHVPKHVRIRGKVHVPSFEKALDFLSARHFALRTLFIEVAGKPRQVVTPRSNFRLHYEDLSELEQAQQRTVIRQQITESEAVPFNLRQGPLCRVKLFKQSDEEWYFYINMHHIITDGWSNDIFLRDLTEIYRSMVQGSNLNLASIEHQYVDYAEWQEKEMKTGRWDHEADYWLNVLAKPLPVLELPTDFPRPSVVTYNGNLLLADVPSELTARLRALTSQEGVSLYMVLMAAYVMLLHELTNQDDVIVGTPIAGRTVASLEPIIGFFVNTLAIRVRMDGVQTLQDLLRVVKEQILGAYQNQSYPFDLLIEKVNPDRDTSRSPIFSTMFVYEKSELLEVDLGQVVFQWINDDSEHSVSKFDLALMTFEKADELQFGLEFNTDLFEKATVERFMANFFKVLEAFGNQLTSPIAALDLLGESDRTAYAELNQTQSDVSFNRTVHEVFYEQAVKHADHIAVSDEHQTMSYRELNERSNQLAHLLRERGVKANQFVGIMMERGVESIVSMLGVMKAGAAYLPIDPEYPEDRILYMAEDSGASLFVTKRALVDRLASLNKEPICFEDLAETLPTTDVQVVNTADDLAYIIYTSGSTGRPKGVMVAHAGVVNMAEAKRSYGFTQGDTVLQFISHSFDASVGEIFPALLNGARLHVLSNEQRQSVEAYADAVEQTGATTGTVVPVVLSQMATWLDDEQFSKLRTLKRVIVGGEALQPEVVRAWNRRAENRISIYNEYGPTEATVTSTVHRVDVIADDQLNIPIGKPLPNYELHILNQWMQPCPVGVSGELYIGGIGLAKGYLNQPALTEQAFVNHPFAPETGAKLYKTGDLVRLLPSGVIEFVGRIDAQVKVRGFRVEIGEIENVLLQHPDVEGVAVVAHRMTDDNNALFGFYTTAQAEVTEQDLKDFLAQKVPGYMVPTQLERLDVMPVTPNGKVDRKALEQLVASDLLNQTRTFDPPATPTEIKLAEIWAEVLNLEAIGRHDHFFELGGHSLLATQVFNRIQRVLKASVTLKELFAYPTLAQLAIRVDEARASNVRTFSIKKAAEKEHYPLSNAQKRLWFLYKFDPTSVAYRVPMTYLIQEVLDVQAFEQALQHVIMRHDSLRTVFIEVDGEARQAVKPQSDIPLDFVDVSMLECADRLERISETSRVIEETPFDLTAGPLMRVTLFKTGDAEFYFHVNMHHIITDGWSVGLLVRELAEAYRSLETGEQPQSKPLAVQYVDYAEWQTAELMKGRWKEEEAYWLDTLAKPLPVLELPTDFPRPDVQTFNGDVVRSVIATETIEKLRSLALQEDVTMYMMMLAAYTMTLQHLSQQEDLIIGTPNAGRNHADVEGMIGFFVNTLAIRTRFDEIETLQDLLQVIKRQTLDAYTHASYPFDLLIEKVNPERDTSRSPIFTTVFSYLTNDLGTGDQQLLNIKQVPNIEYKVSKFDLTLSVAEDAAGYLVEFEYNTDLFKQTTVSRFAELFHTVLQAFIHQLAVPFQGVQLQLEADRALVAEMNDTQEAYSLDETIHGLFNLEATYQASKGDHLAISDGHGSLTYRQLQERSNQLAHALREKRYVAQQFVGIMMERSVEMVVAILGVLKAGGVYVPIDPNYPEDRVRYMLEDSGITLVVTQKDVATQWQLEQDVFCVEDVPADTSTVDVPSIAKPEDLAYMIYTSGSTGRPKGTQLHHVGVLNLAYWKRDEFGYGPQDTILQFASFSFDASVWEVFPALLNGARLHLLSDEERQSVAAFADAVQREKATTVTLPTVFFNQLSAHLAEEDLGKFKSMKRIFVAGEALQAEAVRAWQRRFGTDIEIINAYGPTESTVCATVHRITEMVDEAQLTVPIGQPIANTEIYILNRHLQPCPVHVPGEIYIGSVGLAVGYLNQPEKTAEAFVPHPFRETGAMLYKTGDIARLLPNGQLEYLGRLDAQVKIRGHRVELGEIEEILLQHADVEIAAVIAEKGTDGTYHLLAFYTTAETQVEAEALREFIALKLPAYMVPSRLFRLETMPLLPNGKVDRKSLAKMAEEVAVVGQVEYKEPSTRLEQELEKIWSEVLKLERISVHANFFELGGHSLLATQVFNRIQKDLHADVTLKDLFANPTIAQLAACLEVGTDEQADLLAQVPRIQPTSKQAHYPLSNAQKRLWFLYKFDPASVAYRVPMTCLIRQSVEVQAFEAALQTVVVRHDSLRTTFSEVEGQPRQLVHSHSDVQLNIQDVSQMETSVQWNEIQEQIRANEGTPFDLTTGPLLRVTLYKMAQDQYCFHLNMHHIITDGWSSKALIRELTDVYQALVKGEEPQLAPLDIQYTDYAQWQQEHLQDGLWDREEAYWLHELAKPLPVLELPTDFPRPEVQTFNGALMQTTVSKETVERLRHLAMQENVTLYMLMLSAYVMMLQQLSQGEDLIVGTPVSGRNSAEVEPLIGMFVNMLAIRTRFAGHETIQDLLQMVKSQSLEAFEHQSYPFDLLIEKLNPDRDMSRSPIFNTMFTYQASSVVDIEGSLNFELVEDANYNVSKYDLSLSIEAGHDEWRVGFEYNTDLFKSETIQRFVDLFHQTLDVLVTDTTAPLAAVNLLTEADLAVYSKINQTAAAYDLEQLLHEAFIQQAEMYPERIALSYEGQTMTYGELHTRSNQLAHFLREQGVRPNSYVAIMMERSLEMMVGLYAILKSGAAYVPIDPDYPAQRVQYMISNSEAPVLLSKQVYRESISEIAAEVESLQTVVLVDGAAEAGLDVAGVTAYSWSDVATQPVSTPSRVNEPTDLAYMIYTSGSTGLPKGVKLPHRAVVNSLTWMQENYSLVPADVVAQRTSFCFDTSIWELFWPLREGASMAILSTEVVKNPLRLLATLISERATVVNFVPSLFAAFTYTLEGLEPDQRQGLHLRTVLLCGEPVVPKPVNAWYDMFPRGSQIINLYGPTEAAIAVTGYVIPGKQQQNITIGKPMANVQLFVLDRNGRICPIGVPGELHIGGVQVADGYHNLPEKTAEVFLPNHLPNAEGERLYKTGDLVRLSADGNIEYISRIDNQVKIRGFRIELGEIEETLSEHPDVELAVVVTKKGADGNYSLFAFYTTLGTEVAADELQAFMGQKLPDYMVPTRLQRLADMPLAPNGKVDRKALAQMAAEDVFELSREYVAPTSPAELKLAGIWSEVLKQEQIGVHDNFFELGGHSLLAMQVFNRVQKELQVTIELKDLFANATLHQLAAKVEEQLASGVRQERIQIKPVPQQAHYPLSNAQKRLWFLYKFDPTSTAYNIPAHYVLNGRLDVLAFERAVQHLVMRHESLRTVFVELGEEVCQMVRSVSDIHLVYEDLTAMSEEAQRTQIQQKVQTCENVPFNLTEGPLMRVMLFGLGEEKFHFYFNMHHIISDGWSLNLFMQELAEVYPLMELGLPVEPRPLPLRYVDYAGWQEAEMANGRWKQEAEYWLRTLAKPLPVLELPTDYPRPEVQTTNGDFVQTSLSAETVHKLRALAAQEDVTMYMMMLSSYVMLLHHLSQGEDIIVGTPIAGRNVEELEQVIGFFVNTLAIRTQFADLRSLQDLVQAVKRQVLDAHANQSYPFDMLIEHVNPERDTSRTPIFTTMFNFMTSGQEGLSLGSVTASQLLEVEHHVSKFDLTLSVVENAGSYEVGLEYNTDLFKRETILHFMELFQQVLSAFVERLTVPFSELRLLTAADEALYQQVNDTKAEFPSHATIHELFYEQVAKRADQIAVFDSQSRLSYRELNERSNQVAHLLRQRGVGANQTVAVMLDRTVDLVVAIMGVLKSGGAYVPVDANLPEDRIRYILTDSGSNLLLTKQARLANVPQDVAVEIVCVEEMPTDLKAENLEVNNKPDDLAYIIYTSGSTGRPKGTKLSHIGVPNLAMWMNRDFKYTAADVMLQFASYSFDASVWETFTSLLTGSSMYMLSDEGRKSVEAFAAEVERSGASVVLLPTVFFKQLISYLSDEDFLKLKTIRAIFVGGEALPAEVVRAWQRRAGLDTEISNIYGPTEATVSTTIHPIRQLIPEEQVNIPIGKPLTNTQVYVLNRWLQPLPVGVTGELYMSGVGLAQGYLNQPDKTAEAFIPHPFEPGQMMYKSGDMARLLPDGSIEYAGRRDAQVKIRGFRIEMGEIEEIFLKHPEVELAAVVAETLFDGTKRLIAYYTLQDGSDLQVHDIKEYLGAKLAEYMIPSLFQQLKQMPLTPTGKIDRKSLPKLDVIDQDHEFVAPRTELEQQIWNVWKQCLTREQVGVTDNFFAIGGDSIISMQVVSRLNRAGFGVKTSDLFKHQTIARLATHIETNRLFAERQVLLDQKPVVGEVALSPIQQRILGWNIDQEYNFITLFMEISKKIDSGLMQQTIQMLVDQHDMLRATYLPDESGLKQVILAPEHVQIELLTHDVSLLEETKQEAECLRIERELKNAIKFGSELVMKVALVKLGDDQYRLLWVLHHLLSDMTSIGILKADLIELYEALEKGERATLPYKTTSFAEWLRRSTAYINSESGADVLAYWKPIVEQLSNKMLLPLDYPEGTYTLDQRDQVLLQLDEQTTADLLGEINLAFGTTVKDVLLAVIARSMAKWSNRSQIALTVQGNGRESFDDQPIDLTRTVGFFTSFYPLRLHVHGQDSAGDTLLQVRDELQKMPLSGTSFDMLRFLSQDPAVAQLLSTYKEPDVVFNYQGQLDNVQAADNGHWQLIDEQVTDAEARAEGEVTWQKMSIVAFVKASRLNISFTFSNQQFRRETIERLGKLIHQEARHLVEQCLSVKRNK